MRDFLTHAWSHNCPVAGAGTLLTELQLLEVEMDCPKVGSVGSIVVVQNGRSRELKARVLAEIKASSFLAHGGLVLGPPEAAPWGAKVAGNGDALATTGG